ncbi:MAG: hypothetical protein ACXWQJ_14085 [Bdellovibrionota bacterium]
MKVHNQTWWGSLQQDGAAQFDTLSDKKDVLTFEQFKAMWFDGNDPLICTRAASFADIQKNYQIICSAYPSECTVDGVQKMKTFFARVKKVKHRNQMLNMELIREGDFSELME